MDYNRLVIDTIKQSFSEFVSTGEIDNNEITAAMNSLNLEYDRMKVAGEDTAALEALRGDLSYVKYDLLGL